MYVVVVMLFFLRVVEYFCGGLSDIRMDHYFFVLVPVDGEFFCLPYAVNKRAP